MGGGFQWKSENVKLLVGKKNSKACDIGLPNDFMPVSLKVYIKMLNQNKWDSNYPKVFSTLWEAIPEITIR